MPLTALQQKIVRLCEHHERSEIWRLLFIPPVQDLYEKAIGDESAPRIPKVYDYFCPEDKVSYFVMEYIHSRPTLVRNAPEKVADALQWLYRLPAPPGVVIGPPGGGLAYHTLFKDFEAPFPFSSKEALQRYMNKALECTPPVVMPKEIDFSNEFTVFTQSSMYERNFLIDTNDKICMVDFEGVGLLPQSFASYTMHCGYNPFVKEVASYLDWSPSPNLYSMAEAQSNLIVYYDETLGLDEHGWPIEE